MLFELGQLTTNTVINQTCWTLLTFATPGRVRLIELATFNNVVTASALGLGRPGAVGITPTTPVDFLAQDPTDALAASSIQGVVAGWGTLPTIPTNFLRRWNNPGVIGQGNVFVWPRGLLCDISGNLVLNNISATGGQNVFAICEI